MRSSTGQTWGNAEASGGKHMRWAPGEPWGMLIWDVAVDVAGTYEPRFAIGCAGGQTPCAARTRDVVVNGLPVCAESAPLLGSGPAP